MWLIAMKGYAGCGKSALARALSREFHWPVIDKDDIRDLLDDQTQTAGPLAYMLMFNIARRQLLQHLNVICDSPLTGSIAYERAQAIANEAHASLAIVECICSDEALWRERINGRKALHLPAHHQTNWETFQAFLHQPFVQEAYPITHPHLILDTAQPFDRCLKTAGQWLEQLFAKGSAL